MTDSERQNLNVRNDRIIQTILKQIKRECPDSVDLIGIGGSFCNGDIHESSDLDLAILVNNSAACVLNKCFILGNVGFDVYTQNWSRFELMAEYNHPYVTKLFNLDIIYKRNDAALDKYMLLRQKVKENMQDSPSLSKKIGQHFSSVLTSYRTIEQTTELSTAYRCLSEVIYEIEYIIYMLNRTYIKRGVKRIPEEISNMSILPDNFLPTYLDITNCASLDDIKNKSSVLVESVRKLLSDKDICYSIDNMSGDKAIAAPKRSITSENLTGTYEEIHSNWKNKMYHAIKINSRYLSFSTMASCQVFYDEMALTFDIPSINLLVHYNPNDLEKNAYAFDDAMLEWKKLYDLFDKDILKLESLDELDRLYKD